MWFRRAQREHYWREAFLNQQNQLTRLKTAVEENRKAREELIATMERLTAWLEEMRGSRME